MAVGVETVKTSGGRDDVGCAITVGGELALVSAAAASGKTPLCAGMATTALRAVLPRGISSNERPARKTRRARRDAHELRVSEDMYKKLPTNTTPSVAYNRTRGCDHRGAPAVGAMVHPAFN